MNPSPSLRRNRILLALATCALLVAACGDSRPELAGRTPMPPWTPGPSVTPFTSDLSQITGIEVIPSITRPDSPFTVIITYLPGKTSSNIPCFIMEEGTVVASWKSPTEDAYPDDPARFKTIQETFDEGMADIGHFLIECESPADDGAYSADLDITPGGLPPTSSAPDLTFAPETTSTPTTTTPPVASGGPFAGLWGGDLVFDLASSTSDNPAYPQPIDSCWPRGYNTTDVSGIKIDAMGPVSGTCGAKDSNGTGYEGRIIAGYYVPEVNDLAFSLETLMQIPNVGATGFGIMTKYWITFDAKGSLVSPTKAAGTATWKLDCLGGDTLKCSTDPALADEMTAEGTINWTLTFPSAP